MPKASDVKKNSAIEYNGKKTGSESNCFKKTGSEQKNRVREQLFLI